MAMIGFNGNGFLADSYIKSAVILPRKQGLTRLTGEISKIDWISDHIVFIFEPL